MSQVLVKYAIIRFELHFFSRSDSWRLEDENLCINPLFNQLLEGLFSTRDRWWKWNIRILWSLLFFFPPFSWLWGSVYRCHWGLPLALPCHCCFLSLWCWYHPSNVLCKHVKIDKGLTSSRDEMGLILRLSSIDTDAHQVLLLDWFHTFLSTCSKMNYIVWEVFTYPLLYHHDLLLHIKELLAELGLHVIPISDGSFLQIVIPTEGIIRECLIELPHQQVLIHFFVIWQPRWHRFDEPCYMFPRIPFFPIVLRELRWILYIPSWIGMSPHRWWVRQSEIQLHGLGGLLS